jgi:hypothetical protein
MMFGHLPLLGSTMRSIRVDTHLGNAVENDIAPATDQRGRTLYEVVRRRHPLWKNRRPATGTYNCFGLAFASRRTSIRADAEVEKVRHDDGYRTLGALERPSPGDVVIYRAQSGALLHVAVVTRVELMHPESSAFAVFALSKWNDHYGEDEHEINDHPLRDLDAAIELWSDRPSSPSL